MRPNRPRFTQPRRQNPLIVWMRDRRPIVARPVSPYATGAGIVLGFILALAVLHHLFH